mmetsp:Transcript_55323/g.98473  ORF Transcript_55323/g.98473 Transcript_55323/m.98473 type:complete len:354 (-) Transcript_55323:81-1142(-)
MPMSGHFHVWLFFVWMIVLSDVTSGENSMDQVIDPHTELMPTVIDNRTSTAFVTFLDQRSDSFVNAFRLAQSLRHSGGVLARCDIFFYTDHEARACVKQALLSLGAHVRRTIAPQAFLSSLTRTQAVYFNKLLALMSHNVTTEIVVYLDLDVLVLRDFSEVLDKFHVQAKPADHQRPAYPNIALAFAQAGVPPPPRAVYLTLTGRPLTAYFQGGVLFFPASMLPRVLEAWAEAYYKLAKNPRWAPRPFRRSIDQVAFAAAIAVTKVPFRPLSIAFNYPPAVIKEELRVNSTRWRAHAMVDPFIVHHHREGMLGSTGLLRPPRTLVRLRTAVQAYNQQVQGKPSPADFCAATRP